MATLQQLQEALIRADRAGDINAANIIANEIKKGNYTGEAQAEAPTITEEERISAHQKMAKEAFAMTEPVAPKQEAKPTLGEKAMGVLETGLTIGTGATSGAAAFITGTLRGIAEELQSGKFGTREAASRITKQAEELQRQFTYEPKTETGQQYLQQTAETLAPLEALTPMAGTIEAPIASAKTAIGAKIGAAVEPYVSKIIKPPPIAAAPAEESVAAGQKLADIAKKATKGNMEAKTQLATELKANPQAVQAAERLGIDVPIDVLSDSTLIKQVAGVSRSKVGGLSAAFEDMIKNAVDKADDILNSLNRSDLASMNIKVKDAIDKDIRTLGNQSKALRAESIGKMDKAAMVSTSNSKSVIDNILQELGGDSKYLDAQERKLFKMLESDVSFGTLERVRQDIGEAVGAMPKGQYATANKSTLKALYGAIKQDQLDAVESALGAEARQQLHLSDRIFQKKTATELQAARVFGVDGDKSISKLLESAIVQGKKGDISILDKVLKSVPDDLKSEAVASGLGAASTRDGKFSFNNYAKIYQGLRDNAPVYNQFIKTLGTDKHQVLQDLFVISKRINEAQQKIPQTGKGTQAALQEMMGENLMQKMLKTTLEKGINKATLGGLDPDVSGLFTDKSKVVKSFDELLKSKELKDIATKATLSKEDVSTLGNSEAFGNWAKAVKLGEDPRAWIYSTFITQEQEQ